MRWHPEENDVVAFTEGSELWCNVASIVIKNKQPFATNSLCLSMQFKVLNLLKANLISSPSIWTN
jgi:hypothetical protein